MPPVADPRPRLVSGPDGVVVAGQRCRACGLAVATAGPRCPACGGTLDDARFGPQGTVWSSTVVRVEVPGRPPPHVLAYVDLDGGPRVLASVDPPAAGRAAPLPVGQRVRLVEPRDGDVAVSVVEP